MPVNIGPKIGIEGESEYRKQINQIITQAKTLSSEMKKLESSFKNEGRSLSENASKRRLLNEQIKNQETRVKELSSMLDKSKEKFGEEATETLKWQQALNNAETELNQLKNTLKDMPNSLQLVGQNMQDIGSKWKSAGDSIKSVGQGLTQNVTVPIVGAFAGATKAAVDWETAFTGVMKTVDASDAEYAQLASNIKQMATETASSKTDIAGVMEVAGQLGISGVENLTAFTRTMVELGDTTNLSSEEAASALARFMNITGEDTANVEQLGSAIVDLGNNFATDEASIVAMSTRLASAGSIAGLSSTEILGLSAAMSSVGIEAEAGGTAMTQTLTNISSAVSEGGEKLDAIAKTAGTTASDFAQKWQSEPVAALQQFIGGLSEMNAAGEDTYAVLNELGMDGIRQSNMLQSLALASDMMTEAINTSNSAYTENSALQDEASKRYETTAAKISQAKEQVTNLAVEIGERFVPYVEKGVTIVGGLVEKWDSLSTAQQDTIVKFGLIAAAVGPVLTVVGTLVSTIGTIISVGGTLVSAIGTAAPVFATIGTAISGVAASAVAALPGVIAFLAPFTPFIAIGAAVVAAGVLIYKNWDTIKETAQKVGAAVAEHWGNIKAKTAEAWGNVKAKTTETWNSVKSTVTTVGSAISSTAKGSLDRIKNAFNEHGGGVKGAVAAAWQGIKEYYTDGFRLLNTLTNGKLTEIKDIFVNKFNQIKQDALNWGKDMMENFISGIKSKVDALKQALSDPAQAVKNIFGHSHPTQGPMKDDYKWMPDMMKLWAQGIKRNSYLVESALENVATDISVGVNGYQQAADDHRRETRSAHGLSIDADALYAAVKQGASDATVSIVLDGRELRRTLDGMGVVLA